MSWDVVLFNFHGAPPTDLSALPDDYVLDPLGPSAAVRHAITQRLPQVDWSDPVWGMYVGSGFTFEFNTGKEDPIMTIMIHVRGGGDAVAALLHLAVPNQWTLFDCSTGEFIDPNQPSQAGWEDFQAYRDTIIRRNAATDES